LTNLALCVTIKERQYYFKGEIKMRFYREGTKIVEYLSLVKCNMCGAEFSNGEEEFYDSENIIPDVIHQFKVSFGYGSKFDGVSIQFDLCDDCLEKIFKSFVVPVDTKRWI
jgi:hypothetical protein